MDRHHDVLRDSSSAYDHDSSQRRLEQDRYENDQRLKRRFEHIFRKYEHDFEGVGDEIDIRSGDVVVNNGHLQYMRHEVDPGKSASSRFVRTFQEKLYGEEEGDVSDEGEEDEEDYEHFDGQSEDDDDDQLEYDDAFTEDSASEQLPYAHHHKASATSKTSALLSAFENLKRPAPRLARIFINGETSQSPDAEMNPEHEADETSSQDSIHGPDVGLSNVPDDAHTRRDAMRPSKASQDQSVPDGDPIQTLGVTIANQLAQLMAGPGGKEKKKKKQGKKTRMAFSKGDPAWSYPEIVNPRAGQKRRRSPSPTRPAAISSPAPRSPGEDSLWAPEGSVRPEKRRRAEVFPEPHEETPLSYAPTPKTSRLNQSNLMSSGGRSSAADVQRCWNCSLTNSLKWHKGPHDQDLCSSCGRYFERHRRMKPFDSPTPPLEDEDHDIQEISKGNRGPGRSQGHRDVEIIQPPINNQPPMEPARLGHPNFQHKRSMQQKNVLPQPESHEEKTATDQPSQLGAEQNSRQNVDSHQNRSELKPWTAQEDALIIKLKEIAQMPYTAIAQHFPSRTRTAVKERYRYALRKGPSAGRTFLLNNPELVQAPSTQSPRIHRSVQNEPSTNEVEEALHVREHQNPSRVEFSNSLSGHTRDGAEAGRSLVPDVKPKIETLNREARVLIRWTAEEDALLVRLKEIEHLPWPAVAARFERRNQMTVQKRYTSKLAPQMRKTQFTLPNDPVQGTMEDRIVAVDPELAFSERVEKYSPDEDRMIQRLRDEEHLRWDEIAALVPVRSAKSLKHRYQYICGPAIEARWREQRPIKKEPAEELPDNGFTESGALLSCFRASTPNAQASDSAQISQHEGSAEGYQSTAAADAANIDPRIRQPQFYDLATLQKSSYGTDMNGEEDITYDADLSCVDTSVNDSESPLQRRTSSSSRSGPGSRKRFSKVEDNAIKQMRENDGASWEDIAIALPGRSVKSIVARHGQICGSSHASRSMEQPKASTATSQAPPSSLKALQWNVETPTLSTRKKGNPLLRKALDNSLRRRSDQQFHDLNRTPPISNSAGGRQSSGSRPHSSLNSSVPQDGLHTLGVASDTSHTIVQPDAAHDQVSIPMRPNMRNERSDFKQSNGIPRSELQWLRAQNKSDSDSDYEDPPIDHSQPKSPKARSSMSSVSRRRGRQSRTIIEIPGSDSEDDISLAMGWNEDETYETPVTRSRNKNKAPAPIHSNEIATPAQPHMSSSIGPTHPQSPPSPASNPGIQVSTPAANIVTPKVGSSGTFSASNARASTPTAVFISHSTPASKRVSFLRDAQTPFREVDSDEDELA